VAKHVQPGTAGILPPIPLFITPNRPAAASCDFPTQNQGFRVRNKMSSPAGQNPTMNRPAAILIAGVFLPSLFLGWLALRTIGEQQFILERRTAELFQAEADALAGAARRMVEGRQRAFGDGVAELLAKTTPADLADNFSSEGRGLMVGSVPFAVGPEGEIASPRAAGRTDKDSSFLAQNSMFLSNTASAEVYQTQTAGLAAAAPPPARTEARGRQYAENKAKESRALAKMESSLKEKTQQRAVQPLKVLAADQAVAEPPAASVVPELSDFRTATATGEGGVLARFVDNELQWFLWSRPPAAEGYVFGCMVPSATMQAWFAAGGFMDSTANGDLCLSLLNERAQPVFVSIKGFEADWKRPFVSAEIGDILPFWEAAAYLVDPSKLDASARAARTTLGSMIALALSAIAAAGYFVWRDARRQIELAARKTDFVSNVSHELKTPLTSIRMFAELLATPSGEDPEKRTRYLRVITLESERLTRLINNVLDFARIDKKRKTYTKHPIDLHAAIARVWEGTELHLSADQWQCTWMADDPPYMVMADEDAISQVLVNLFSNAEKYGADGKSLDLRTWKEELLLHVAVLDRGPGVPPGQEVKIFEAFYRASDSLDSGTQGSGLGLALANRIILDHGGTLQCSPRRGGGACFTFTLPLIRREPVSEVGRRARDSGKKLPPSPPD